MGWKGINGLTAEGRLDLSAAYERVFVKGNASKEDKENVLIDIIQFSGYLNVSTKNETNYAYREGARSVGGLVFSMINLPEKEINSLYQVIREKTMQENYDG